MSRPSAPDPGLRPPLAPSPPPAAEPGLRLGGLGLVPAALALALAAAGLAGLAGWALAQGLGLAAGTAAAIATLGGMVGTVLPVALLLRRLARRPLPAAELPPPVDPGTGAAHRNTLLDLAAREWSRSRRYGTGAAVLLIDVDRCARLCETHGADAGEAVLRELARQTAPTLRGADVLARFSGSQLAVFLVQADATGALDVAERIRERAEQLDVPWHPQRLRVTVSVGVAHLRPAHAGLPMLFEDAEDALAAAREAGGNCVRAAPVERRATPASGSPGASQGDQRTRPH